MMDQLPCDKMKTYRAVQILTAICALARPVRTQTCTPFSYDVVPECQVALASGTYDACSDIYYLASHRVICELRTPGDLIALRQSARILSTVTVKIIQYNLWQIP